MIIIGAAQQRWGLIRISSAYEIASALLQNKGDSAEPKIECQPVFRIISQSEAARDFHPSGLIG
jgi:hypothetical protein